MKNIFLILFVCVNLGLYSQSAAISFLNMIDNHDFENFSACPSDLGELNKARSWFSPNKGTPDYFNACDVKDRMAGVPDNFLGMQPAYSGLAYAGIFRGDKEVEYITVKVAPLKAGEEYCIRFFAGTSAKIGEGLDAIGVMASEKEPKSKGIGMLEDKDGLVIFPDHKKSVQSDFWSLMSASFTAKGGEEYITIGYFREGTAKAYTFIDKVYLAGRLPGRDCGDPSYEDVPDDVRNFVPNQSFENMFGCPGAREELNFAKYYHPKYNTPDFYHECGTGSASAPENILGMQEPKTGSGYGGLWLYLGLYPDYREAIHLPLKKTMVKDSIYCISLFASLAEVSELTSPGLQAYLSASGHDISTDHVSPEAGRVILQTPEPIINTEDWFLLKGVYRAKGGEKVLTLGNFVKGDELVLLRMPKPVEHKARETYPNSAYFYVDDISVMNISACDHCDKSDIPEDYLAVKSWDEEFEDLLFEMEEIEQQVYDAEKWEEGKHFVLPNILFEYDQAILLESSYESLDKVLGILKENPNIRIEIGGHTDNIGNEAYNKSLSERRARAVQQYFLQRGIDEGRMEVKGYGSKEPFASNDIPEGRELNRRVEITVLSK